ncbi:TonB-dependent receptor [Celeribacter sp.]|uniref:TonB-dependent receptor n=1 Tax=Celeribacter sp. TaxID=1890673 RepID=UPI003A9107A7
MATAQSKFIRTTSLMALVASLSAQGAMAQGAGEIIMLDPIIVSGEKVDRDLSETSTSVSVVGEAEIENQKVGRATIDEVVASTPNVIYPDNVSAPVIRGIDTQGPQNGAVAFFGGTVPRGTVSVDGHYQDFYELTFGASSTWDVDTVEVFSGPQTTSQGANAIAGAIVVNTKDPTFTPEGAYRAEYGSYNTRRLSFAYSNALSDDLAGRIAVDYSGRDGIIDYTNPGFVPGDANLDFENLNLRGKLLWKPAEIAGLEMMLTLAHSDGNRPTQEMATTPYDDLDNSYATSLPSLDVEVNTATLDVNYDFFNGMKLFNQLQVSQADTLRTTGIGRGDAIIKSDEVSNEIQLSFGDSEDELSGLVGFYAKKVDRSDDLWLYTAKADGVTPDTVYEDEKTYLGLFGETTWNFADRWSLNAGLRIEKDRIQREGTSLRMSEDVDYDETFTEVLPRLALSYELTPDWTVGALYSKGYNPGGVSPNFTTGTWEEFKAETIDNYELFARARLMGDQMFLTANLFYMDYANAQYNILNEVGPGDFNTYTINAEESYAYGLDLGIDYAPSSVLTLNGSLGLLKTKITEISRNTDFEDNSFAKAPPVTLSLGADWAMTDQIRVGGQLRHVAGGYFSDAENTEDYKIGNYTITDLQASYAFNDGIELYGYVNNIFDIREDTFKQFNRTQGGTEAAITAPRTVGIGIRGTF